MLPGYLVPLNPGMVSMNPGMISMNPGMISVNPEIPLMELRAPLLAQIDGKAVQRSMRSERWTSTIQRGSLQARVAMASYSRPVRWFRVVNCKH